MHPAVRRLDEAVLVDLAVGRQRADQADVRAFRRLDRADAAVVAVVNVAHVEAGAVAGEAAGPSAESRRLCVSSASGLVWSMNCESCEPPKNSFIAATTGRMLISALGVAWSGSVIVMRSRDHALHAQQADAELVLDQLAHGAHAAVAQVVDVVRFALAVVERISSRTIATMSSCVRMRVCSRHGRARAGWFSL